MPSHALARSISVSVFLFLSRALSPSERGTHQTHARTQTRKVLALRLIDNTLLLLVRYCVSGMHAADFCDLGKVGLHWLSQWRQYAAQAKKKVSPSTRKSLPTHTKSRFCPHAVAGLSEQLELIFLPPETRVYI